MEMFWLHLWAESKPSFRLAEWDIWDDQSAIKKQRHKQCLQSLVKSDPNLSVSAECLFDDECDLGEMWCWKALSNHRLPANAPHRVSESAKAVKSGHLNSVFELTCGPSLYTDNGLNRGQASWGSLSSWGQIISCRGQSNWYNVWAINHTILKANCVCFFFFFLSLILVLSLMLLLTNVFNCSVLRASQNNFVCFWSSEKCELKSNIVHWVCH